MTRCNASFPQYVFSPPYDGRGQGEGEGAFSRRRDLYGDPVASYRESQVEKVFAKLYHVRSMDLEMLADEEKRMRRLRWIVDLNQAVLMQADVTLREAFDIIEETRKAVLAMFPDKGDVFDLIYAPRFKRIIKERFVIPGGMSLKY